MEMKFKYVIKDPLALHQVVAEGEIEVNIKRKDLLNPELAVIDKLATKYHTSFYNISVKRINDENEKEVKEVKRVKEKGIIMNELEMPHYYGPGTKWEDQNKFYRVTKKIEYPPSEPGNILAIHDDPIDGSYIARNLNNGYGSQPFVEFEGIRNLTVEEERNPGIKELIKKATYNQGERG